LQEQRDYVNGIEYKGGVLERIAHTEGAVVRNENGVFEHQYVIKDHLGNARITYRDGINKVDNTGNTTLNDGTIVASDMMQINHYYPFGMNMEGNWNGLNGSNKYQYNKKELNSDFGLDWNDYGARFYDASIGRWNSVDPLSENYSLLSPYNYVTNNPVNAIDPDGRVVIFVNGYRLTGLISSVFREYYRDDYGTKTDWYGYWGETFISKVKNRLGDNNTVFYDGDAPFTTAKTKWGFNHRKQRGGQGARDFDRQVASGNIKLARDSNGKITESVKIFAHSMGYAYAQGMAEHLVSLGYKVEVIYAISPENPSAGQRPDGVDRLVQYGSPDDNVAPQGPIHGVTETDFNAKKSGKWDGTGGHGIGSYDYIFGIQNGVDGEVKKRRDEDKKLIPIPINRF
jgi:RHS repeat-associated protein